MALKTFVKVNNINNLSNARYCTGMGVNVLGFDFEKTSQKYVSPEKFQEISGWLSGVQFAGEFESDNAEEIIKVANQYSIDYIQITSPSILADIATLNIPIILKINGLNESSKRSISQLKDKVDFIILADNLKVSDYESDIFNNVVIRNEFLNAENVLAYQSKSIKGIELTGSDEIKTGFGDFDKIADILEMLEVDD